MNIGLRKYGIIVDFLKKPFKKKLNRLTTKIKCDISVVVPVFNEIGNVEKFHNKLRETLSKLNRTSEIIYIDDNSTDGTYNYLLQVATKTANKNIFDKTKVFAYKKKGNKGKSYSLVEGFAKATGEIFVMIDGDLQYPPSAIPDMVKNLEDSDVVVANRKKYKDSIFRKIMSYGFKSFFGNILFGIGSDIQAGLKVFKRKVYEEVSFTPVTPWAFDLEFLYLSKMAGFRISNYNIVFKKRQNGKSNVSIRQVFELGINALQVRFRKIKPVLIPSSLASEMRGAGIKYKMKKYITHTTLPFSLSAIQTFVLKQKIILGFFIAITSFGLLINPLEATRIIVAFLSILYFVDVFFNFLIILRGAKKKSEVSFTKSEIDAISDEELPVYTVLCPLYKEFNILPQFVEAINKLEWPKDKLDVQLLLEQDDRETIEGLKNVTLPFYIRKVIIPHSLPKTKPKACNYGLSLARGEYLVIYDAEDIPDPRQLKKAYLAFKNAGNDVACFQAKLNYYNSRANLLTRFFTAEYSLWFNLILTGLQSLRSSIPLGGTSNHFKTKVLKDLAGWDPFNVTEDADLGIRLFQKGFRTSIVDSTTLEEATSNFKNWIRQRSRWIKGYMQTYLVHTRSKSEKKVSKRSVFDDFIFQITVGGKVLFVLLNPIMWIVMVLYFTAFDFTGPTIEAIYIPPISYIAVFAFIFGNFLFIYSYMIACAKRNDWDLVKYVFLIPLYWGMMSISGAIALYQLFVKPHYWEKTLHGFHLGKIEKIKIGASVFSIPLSFAKNTSKKMSEIKFFENFDEKINEKKFKTLINSYALLFIFTFDILLAKYFFTIDQFFVYVLISLAVKLMVVISYFNKIVDNNIGSIIGLFKSYKFEKKNNKKKLHVLFFNWRDTKHIYSGGAEVYIHEIAKRFVGDGNRVTVFCGNDNNQRAEEVINGVEIMRRGGTFSVYVYALFYYLLKFRGKVDVIIDCENGIPFFTPLFVKEPVILLVHHVHQEIFRAFLKFPLNYIAEFLEGNLMPLVYSKKKVVTVSQSSREDIISLGFTDPSRIEIIQNGVSGNVSILPAEKTTYPSFIYLGRLKEYKSVDIAIKAFSKILLKHKDARLSIVGWGETYPKLKNLVNNLGLTESINFYGKVDEAKKIQLLSSAWAMIQPSLFEGWGLTVIEANTCKTPVIASRVNGLVDSVIDKSTGILVDVKDVDGFAKAMSEIISDPQYLQILSKEAEIWSKNFSWERSVQEFYQVIDKTVSENKSRASFAGFTFWSDLNN